MKKTDDDDSVNTEQAMPLTHQRMHLLITTTNLIIVSAAFPTSTVDSPVYPATMPMICNVHKYSSRVADPKDGQSKLGKVISDRSIHER